MGDDFVLLADSAASDKLRDKNGEAQPPEVAFDNSLGVKAAKVTRQGRVMNGVE